MSSILIEMTLLNLGALFYYVGLCLVLSLPILGWVLLMFLQERPRY